MSHLVTGVQSLSIPVSDQDRALRFYTEILGCTVAADIEVLGTRLVALTPPGSRFALLLLPADSTIPIATRLATDDAQGAFEALQAAGARVHNDEVLHLPGSPPMFHFEDPDGNHLVFLEEDPLHDGSTTP